jgi:hypothetical protein
MKPEDKSKKVILATGVLESSTMLIGSPLRYLQK